ncbi:MAG: hypothetical protein WCW62_05085 [Bacteroidales bacterium]
MKTKILISVLLIILITSLITVMGQETTDRKKQEADAKKKQEKVAIIVDTKKDTEKELQKAMSDALAAEEKALDVKKEKGYLNNQEYLQQVEAIKDSKRKLQEMRYLGNWEKAATLYGNPSITWQGGPGDAVNIYNFGHNRENSSLSISKSLEDVTFSTDFYYEVKEGTSNISFFVNGNVKAGELKITLKKPDKSAIQEFTISPLADVNWNQQFSWDEEESDGYLGKWSISISASKANGTYRVQVNSR